VNVLVIGANGQIGRHIVELGKNTDVNITAMVRKEEQAAAFEGDGINTVLADLEGSVAELTKVMEGMDAVVFTAGSGGHTGPDKTLVIDLDGAVKSVEAAEAANVDRFIMISAFNAKDRETWNDSPIKPYMVAKHYADRMLMDSKLNYTIIRPGNLKNEAGTGKIQAGELKDYGAIPREDVARVVLESLQNEKTYRTGFDLISGNDEIKDALNF
jgi:uncharacterized protein YbjT (DUF2867 family)